MDTERFELTDIEMALVNGDKDACLSVIKAFNTCEGCSASCRAVAKAQVAKVLAMLEPKPDSDTVSWEAYSLRM